MSRKRERLLKTLPDLPPGYSRLVNMLLKSAKEKKGRDVSLKAELCLIDEGDERWHLVDRLFAHLKYDEGLWPKQRQLITSLLNLLLLQEAELRDEFSSEMVRHNINLSASDGRLFDDLVFDLGDALQVGSTGKDIQLLHFYSKLLLGQIARFDPRVLQRYRDIFENNKVLVPSHR